VKLRLGQALPYTLFRVVDATFPEKECIIFASHNWFAMATVTLPPDLESRVAEKGARRRGLRRAGDSRGHGASVARDCTLPVWPGRVLNDLRREDLYDDVQ